MSHGDGAHTHHYGSRLTISTGGVALLITTALVLAHPRQASEAATLIMWTIGGLALLAITVLAVAGIWSKRHFESERRYRWKVSPPGRIKAMIAEQRTGAEAVRPGRLAVTGPQVHMNIMPGVSPETAAAAIRAMKEQSLPAPVTLPLPAVNDDD